MRNHENRGIAVRLYRAARARQLEDVQKAAKVIRFLGSNIDWIGAALATGVYFAVDQGWITVSAQTLAAAAAVVAGLRGAAHTLPTPKALAKGDKE